MRIIACTAILGWLPLAIAAGPLPELVLPQGVGVNIHFTRGHEQDLDLIAAAGFKFIRMDFGWAGIERNKGEYNWTDYDSLTANLEKRGLRAIYILDYSNPLYEEVSATRNPITGREQRDIASPQHPESVAAFAKWAAAAARHFRGQGIIWEIWNEPNIFFWKPKPDAQQYTALALATGKAIHEAVPEALIIGPASSEMPWAFMEAFLSSGVLADLAAVSVHPYRNYRKSPETAAEDYQKLRELIERYAPNEAKKKLPIISGEWGYASHTKGVSLETQAAFAVRQQLANLLAGIPISIWYDWKNDGPDAAEREHNFGTVTLDLQPKPAYLAIQAMTRELAGYRIVRRLKLANDTDYALLCANADGQQKLAVWTVAGPHSVSLEPGEGQDQSQPTHALNLELGPMPRYVALTGPPVAKSYVPSDYQGRPYEDASYHGGPQLIPGRLQCAFYDLGGEGVAYHDTDSVNHGSGELNRQPNHQRPHASSYFWDFRAAEGVDISYVKDFADLNHTNFFAPDKNQLYIGWADEGEWCNYTVRVKAAGAYKIIALYGNQASVVKFSVDNQSACEGKLPLDTGSMHKWNKAQIGTITFAQPGLHLLTFHYNKGNNFAYFDFELH